MKLSIITVNLNNASGLLKSVESVLNQTYSDYEYIIIDGGSSDGSVDVIKKYADKITYWVSAPDKGIYNAMNKGIKQAMGEYCFFLNSGDFLYSKETIEDVFKIPYESDIIYGDVLIASQFSPQKWVQKHPNDLSFMTFFAGGICHQAAFMKRSLFDKYGFYNESFKIVSDWEFFIKTIIFSNVKYKHIDLIISDYSQEGFGNQNLKTGIAEMQQVFDESLPKLVLKDYEIYKDNYSDIQALINLKKHKLSYFSFKVLKKLHSIFFK